MKKVRRGALYRYLEACGRREGRFPSYREIASAMGWKSTSTVSYHIDRLVREGLLEKEPGKVRSFRLLRYRRSRYLKRQAVELEVRPTGGGPAEGRTIWLDHGWFGGGSLQAWEVSPGTALSRELAPGDCLVIDTDARPAAGDLVLVASAVGAVAGRLFLEGRSLRLLVAEDPEEVLILGEGSLAGEVLGRVVGLVRRA